MTKDELLKKLDFYLKDEHEAVMEYVKLIQELHSFLGTVCIPYNTTLGKCLDDISNLPHDESQHWNILKRLRCEIEGI